MDKLKRLLRCGFVLCLVIDLIVFYLFFKTIVDDTSDLTVYFLLLTTLHILVVVWAYVMLKRYKANYGFLNQQKKIAFLGAVASVIVVIPLFILGEDAIPIAMLLINSVIFLLYPNRNRYIGPIK
ncbi:hypothetical protein [Streptococcus pluranimalium]|uniref:Uncharacterized protein n=1 Tax=Streptococcus pluranimalium TaxID=82348 RepID=A0A2L0D5Q1_9STRE|nr:hypothetical protein [Streptococcus pluranimalium]AUW96911.1 hypothetical protein C0J00_07170 [Streptococcus pluranimalium]